MAVIKIPVPFPDNPESRFFLKGGIVLKSWKTSLAGLAAGALNLLANGTNWKQVLLSVGVAGLGLLGKDFNVTGG